ncbi:MAG: serine/threonine protein kinase, partial [Acidobacteriota bacterium]|nr:serine/threonine protein kinase [Acidobacteriota bacterium]
MSFPPPQPTATFPYRIEAKIGEGAMGVVYRAVEPSLDRLVAIKTLRPELLGGESAVSREYLLRFLQEAKAAAALSHPGATTIYRTGEEAGVPYIAMEWLSGRTLEELVRQGGPLPVEQVLRLGLELLATLEAAHRAGVIHRDIKPANLVLLDDGRLKVTDFGIARAGASDMTETGSIMGTAQYLSPEQAQGHGVQATS